jgi:hypothetical protein
MLSPYGERSGVRLCVVESGHLRVTDDEIGRLRLRGSRRPLGSCAPAEE